MSLQYAINYFILATTYLYIRQCVFISSRDSGYATCTLYLHVYLQPDCVYVYIHMGKLLSGVKGIYMHITCRSLRMVVLISILMLAMQITLNIKPTNKKL